MLTTEVLLPALGNGAILPAVVAAAIALPVIWQPRFGRLLGAVGIAGGVLAATFALGLVPLRPDPEREWHWLPTLTVAAATVGAIGYRWPIRILGGLALAALATYLLIPASDTLPHRGAIRIGLAIVIIATALLDWVIGAHGPRAVFVLGLTAACGAMVLERGATASFAQMSGAVAAAMGGVWFLATRPGVAGGALPIAAVLIPGLMTCGYFNTFSNVPIASYALIAVAPLSLAIPGRGRWGLVSIAVAIAILAVAIGLAVRAEPIDWASLSAPGH